MVVTPSATFMHLPKCAGTFLRNAIKPIIDNEYAHALSFNAPEDRPIFGFVRNPWDWYYSWFNFINNGSTTYNDLGFEATRTAMGNVSYEKYVEMCTNPTNKFKEKAYKIAKNNPKSIMGRLSNLHILSSWVDSDESYYSHLYTCYLGGIDKVGKKETIREDLKSMLLSVDLLTVDLSNHIDTIPRANLSHYSEKNEVNDSVIHMIAESEKKIVNMYGYEFN